MSTTPSTSFRASGLVSPVGWARHGAPSRWLARLLPTQPPPILILSLGRSGSTWVGETLGHASNALYLHEPLTQPLLASGSRTTNFDVDPGNPPAAYLACAQAAFWGLPVFPLKPDHPTLVARHPEQWKLAERGRRRLVIKEINPFACRWLTQTFKPRVIYLVRHPAGVALSNDRLGFLPGNDVWRRQGEHQGRAHRTALDCLEACGSYRVVSYEALCAAPHEQFRALFDFAGLNWDSEIEQFISANSAQGDRTDPWSIARDSQAMIWDWAGRISPEALGALHEAYAGFGLPFYQNEQDWRIG